MEVGINCVDGNEIFVLVASRDKVDELASAMVKHRVRR